jgi:hypothetical protein
MAVHDIANSLNNRQQTDVIILDFSKEFDKVPHERLLQKMQYYGIEDKVCTWVRSFLTGRQQRVIIDGSPSSYLPVTSGVPQGTVLGPILFLLFINDISDNISSTTRLFADDCLLYRTINSPQDHIILQQDLDHLLQWADVWQMKFNATKCFAMATSLSNKPSVFQYNISGTSLASVPSHPYLGVELHHKLSWSPHIDTITAKANKVLGFLRRNLKNCPREIKQKTYQAMVRPPIEYASSVWDPHTKENIQKLNMVQRRGARFVLHRYSRRDSPTQMLSQLGWQSPVRRRSETRLIFLYKIIHRLVAVPITYLPPLAQTRTRRSHDYKYQRYQPNVQVFQFSLLPRTIPQWNLLPAEVVTAPSLDLFKQGLAGCNI